MTEHKPPIQAFEGRHLPPCWLYHSEQGAKIFTNEAELAQAHVDGWRDSPAAAAMKIEHQPLDLPVIDVDLVADEPAPDDGVEVALEAAEDAIEEAQKAPYGGTAEQGGARRVRKKRKR